MLYYNHLEDRISYILATDDHDHDDVLVEYSLGEVHSPLPRGCPFTFLHLSSEDPTPDDPLHDLDQSDPLPGDARNQGVSHVPVSAEGPKAMRGGSG